jgi:hypothetical protein
VNFVDGTVVALADETTRSAVFDSTSLEQILNATYDANSMGPFQGKLEPVFEEFEVGFPMPQLGVLDGTWSGAGGTERTEASFRVTGLGGQVPFRIDALWRGSILARYAIPGEPIEDLSIDWAGNAQDPSAYDGASQVTFAQPQPVSTTRKPLPMAAALLVRDAPLPVADLLAETKGIRERLRPLGLERSKTESLRLLQPILLVWVVPSSTFTNSDWPGADPAARRQQAGDWLSREGIGLAVVP